MCICQNPKSKSRHSDHAASRSHHDSAAYGETSKYFQLRKYFLHFANDFAVKFSLALIDSRPVSDSSFLTTDRDCRTFLNYELCVLNENLHFFPFFPAWVITMVILMESSEVLWKRLKKYLPLLYVQLYTQSVGCQSNVLALYVINR